MIENQIIASLRLCVRQKNNGLLIDILLKLLSGSRVTFSPNSNKH